MTEYEMVGCYHRLNEFEQALGVGDGQGSLACCSSRGRMLPVPSQPQWGSPEHNWDRPPPTAIGVSHDKWNVKTHPRGICVVEVGNSLK